jgi:DNA-binding IclR family transcriptional regulator
VDEIEFRSEKDRQETRPEPVAALRNGVRVLKAFSVAEPVLGVTEIARRLGLSPSTVYRALTTLADEGLVERDPDSDRYRLSVGVVALAGPLLANLDIRDVARPYLEHLALACRESVNLGVWNRVEAINIEQVPGPGVIKHLAPLGRRNPAHASATGKVLLAHAEPRDVHEVLDRGLQRFTERTIVDPAVLREELARVRGEGYALNDEELLPELVAVAAPVFDHRGRVVAAVSISAPSFHVPVERVAFFAALVKDAAGEISRRMGYAGVSSAGAAVARIPVGAPAGSIGGITRRRGTARHAVAGPLGKKNDAVRAEAAARFACGLSEGGGDAELRRAATAPRVGRTRRRLLPRLPRPLPVARRPGGPDVRCPAGRDPGDDRRRPPQHGAR